MEIRLKEEGSDDEDELGDKQQQQNQNCDEREEEIMDSEDENHETHIHDMGADEEADGIEAEEENNSQCETVTTQEGEEEGFEANIVDGNFIIRIPNQHNAEQSLAALQQLSEQSANIVDMNSEIVEEIEIGHQEVFS